MRLSLIGFGTVGQGLCEIIRDHDQRLVAETGVEFSVVAVCDMLKGSLYDPAGLDIDALLAQAASGESLEALDAPHKGWDAQRTIREAEADAICEATYTDLETGEPATAHLRAAIAARRHIATTNKGPLALHGRELLTAAAEVGVMLLAEGTVVSGTPVLNLAIDPLAGAGITAARGILNGTTNYMLCEMEAGRTYAEALAEAQRLGYAEADPTGDVEGLDAAGKVTILANLLMGGDLTPVQVDRTGITGLTPDDIARAKAEGQRWKLIGEVRRHDDGRVSGRVAPEALPLDDPLAAIGGATNALTFETMLLGPVTIVGAGAGRIETGYALLTDLLAIAREIGGSTRAPP